MAVASAQPLKYNELTLNLADVQETGKKLGEGSYGEVMEVMYLGTACAAKRIHLVWEQLGGKPEEEFKRECEIWSRLRHPNVVQLLGLLYKPSSGPATNLPTIVMEKMDCSLRHFVDTHPRESIPLAVKVDVLYQVAQGLAYLHGQRPPVVHRDLSPNNILISLGSMTAKLSDFGVARVFHSQASKGTRVPGTQHFMPPETLPQAFAAERGCEDRIDVFSFGCIVICAVTHMWPEPLPPVQQTKAGKLVALTEVERRQAYINHFDPQEKTSFFRMVLHCLEFTPSKRPKSIALLKAMRELKDAHPLRAYFGLLQELQAVQDEPGHVHSQLSAVQEKKASLQMEANEQTFHQHPQLQELQRELRDVHSQLSAMQEEKDCLLKVLEAKEQILQQQQLLQMLRVKKTPSTSDEEDTGSDTDGQNHDETYPEECEVDQVPPLEDDDGSIRSGSSQFPPVPQMNQVFHGQTPPVFYQATGAGLMPQGQPMFYPAYQMVHPGMVIGAGTQHRQQGMMFPPHVFAPGHMQLPFGARHDLSTPQAPTQKYPQQPQQPSTQLQPKAQTTSKHATKALYIVDPDTNKPLDLVGVSFGSKSKSPEPASVTSPTQDAKWEEFMAKISGKSNPSEDSSQTEPSEQAREEDFLRPQQPQTLSTQQRLTTGSTLKPQGQAQPAQVQDNGRGDMPDKQTGGKLVEQAPPSEMVVSDALSDEEVEKKSKTIVGELSSKGDYREAQLCVSELRSPGKLHLFVNTVLNHTLEKSSKDRQVAGVLLDQLLRERVLPVEAFMKGLNDVLEFAEDYECDIPKFWDYIAELLAPSVAHKGFPLVTLKQAHEGPLESGKIGKLVAKTLHKCTSLQGVTEDQVYDVWSQSGIEWSTHLYVPPKDLDNLLEDHKLTFLTQKPPTHQSVSSGGVSQTARGDPKDWSRVLEEQMGSNHMTNNALFTYIETKHATEHRSPQFIFSLSSALTRAVVRGAGDSAIFSEDLFRKRCPVLKKYVEGDPELQLQVIYGIQVTLAQKQHPKDVLCTMFNQLYDDDIVSDDTFYSWEETGREDLEGRAVTLVVARNFLQWLRSTGEEEGEGTVQ